MSRLEKKGEGSSGDRGLDSRHPPAHARRSAAQEFGFKCHPGMLIEMIEATRTRQASILAGGAEGQIRRHLCEDEVTQAGELSLEPRDGLVDQTGTCSRP